MEPAVELPQYIFFDISGTGLVSLLQNGGCLGTAPAVEHIGVPFDTQVLGLEALHRTRLCRADLATHRPVVIQVGTAMTTCDHVRTTDPDAISDAGTSGVQAAMESEDELDSLGELFFDESFAEKIDALGELVGMKGTYEPAAVPGEVVRVLQEMNRKTERSVCTTRAV
ncbi:uncharacterized protein LOC133884612 [Phragmites australis]|uniref:uncharacterized protein LOC133884612 n=1 Tax=Phragmites australis TaxID=29695 RepID=UPI002D765BD7|nr:uncharacterized protein LOC133884612 [Phragmites australis]